MEKQKKLLLSSTVIIIAVIIVVVSLLSGCSSNNSNTNSTNGNTVKLELVNYSVETRLDLTGEEYKQITGFVKNNGSKTINEIKIIIRFNDTNDNELFNKTSYIYDLQSKKTKEFSTVYHSLTKNYYKVDWKDVGFDLIVIK